MELEQRANEIKQIQIDTLSNFAIDENIVGAIQKLIAMKDSPGKVITAGMGKAGIIAFKMSATLASIGFNSFFVHPAEAAHGDLGRIAPADLVFVFSNSGTTAEVINMINHLHELNNHENYIIHIGGSDAPEIPSDLVISYGKIAESCVVSKVPSTSTTLMLVIADIIAITAAESVGFDDEAFKLRHPGGAIGQSYQKGK